jgi:hypothetical protein
MQSHSQNGYKRTNAPPPEHSAAFEIEGQYRNLAEMLFAAILREPHNFALYAAKMHPIWWHDTQYDKAAQAVFDQAGNYSVRSVCIAAGIETSAEKVQAGALHESVLYRLLNEHADTDLPLALEMFEPVYRQWVEYRCAQFAQHGIMQGWEAERIIEEQAKYRRDRCAYVARGDGNNEDFTKWVQAKIDGFEINYPCKPSLKSMIRQRFKIAWEPGELIIAAGRPSMGKTHWLLNELDNFAKNGVRGIFISADMERLKVQKRLIGQKTGVNPKEDWGALQDYQYQELQTAVEQINNWPIVVIDDVVDIREIVSICYAENFKEKIDFLAIDFIQLLKVGKGGGKENRNLEISEICRELKHLSKTLRMPIIALSQMNRASETRGGTKRPQLSDLRDSGSLEQDASVVLGFYRAEYYGILEDEEGRSLKNVGEIIFLKQQEDTTGILKCKFDGVRGWSDLEEDFRFPNSESGQDFTVPISARPGMEDETDTIPF